MPKKKKSKKKSSKKKKTKKKDTSKLNEYFGTEITEEALKRATQRRKELDVFNMVIDDEVDFNNEISQQEISDAILGEMGNYEVALDMDNLKEKQKKDVINKLGHSPE